MKAMPKAELEVIAYHEGLPGHHMQIAIAQELTGPSRRSGARRSSTPYAEGWGLYAEWLAREMPGTYQDPYSRFGRLGSEMWRAIRLVVDTGLHAKGWSEEQAVQYFLANSATTEAQARSEVRRYMVTARPGHGLQDRHAEDPGAAAQGRGRARRRVSTSARSTTPSSAAARCRSRCWNSESTAGSLRASHRGADHERAASGAGPQRAGVLPEDPCVGRGRIVIPEPWHQRRGQ